MQMIGLQVTKMDKKQFSTGMLKDSIDDYLTTWTDATNANYYPGDVNAKVPMQPLPSSPQWKTPPPKAKLYITPDAPDIIPPLTPPPSLTFKAVKKVTHKSPKNLASITVKSQTAYKKKMIGKRREIKLSLTEYQAMSVPRRMNTRKAKPTLQADLLSLGYIEGIKI